MPSHIFTRLGYWDESAATNLRGWNASEADVKRAHESGAHRDFHNLSYLEYAYIQMGHYRELSTQSTLLRRNIKPFPIRRPRRTRRSCSRGTFAAEPFTPFLIVWCMGISTC